MECDRRENSAFARGPHRQVSSSGVTVPGPGFTPAWKDVLGKGQTPWPEGPCRSAGHLHAQGAYSSPWEAPKADQMRQKATGLN